MKETRNRKEKGEAETWRTNREVTEEEAKMGNNERGKCVENDRNREVRGSEERK